MPKFCANLTLLFNEVPFLERFQAAAREGFEAVEYLFPYGYPKEQLAEELRAHALTQVLHNMPAGDWEAGSRGIGCLPDRVGEFQDGVERTIDYARALGCRRVNCLAGIVRPGADPERCRRTFVDNLKFAAPRLGEAGIQLLIEPINTRDIPGFFLTGTRQALDILADVGCANLYLQYDIYHMQIMEGDLARTIETNLGRIAHMQLADNPGRNEPGTGEIHYPFLFDWIDALGYRGWIGCEYKPRTATAAGLGWVRPYLAKG